MKKKLLKQIRQAANELPDMTYDYFERAWVRPTDDYGYTILTEAAKLRSIRKVRRKINHYRRLRKLVMKYGFDKGLKIYKNRLEKIKTK